MGQSAPPERTRGGNYRTPRIVPPRSGAVGGVWYSPTMCRQTVLRFGAVMRAICNPPLRRF
jgi:hypothetical protein